MCHELAHCYEPRHGQANSSSLSCLLVTLLLHCFYRILFHCSVLVCRSKYPITTSSETYFLVPFSCSSVRVLCLLQFQHLSFLCCDRCFCINHGVFVSTLFILARLLKTLKLTIRKNENQFRSAFPNKHGADKSDLQQNCPQMVAPLLFTYQRNTRYFRQPPSRPCISWEDNDFRSGRLQGALPFKRVGQYIYLGQRACSRGIVWLYCSNFARWFLSIFTQFTQGWTHYKDIA